MAENFYSTRPYKPNHSTFAGNIYESDFDGYVSISETAKRIAQDKYFDIFCLKCDKDRKRRFKKRED